MSDDSAATAIWLLSWAASLTVLATARPGLGFNTTTLAMQVNNILPKRLPQQWPHNFFLKLHTKIGDPPAQACFR